MKWIHVGERVGVQAGITHHCRGICGKGCEVGPGGVAGYKCDADSGSAKMGREVNVGAGYSNLALPWG